ncbi:hypothetical protein CC80DRAFT_491115 [Byssothecium circinans]|uniref:Uncharacterized protein n=1 Tax=Byssothecium circinans TaxID=147558 RepID=A0A6A5TZ80_9PLEO|nr:hypothetical protein CC80DRAFT_491115 [Byssothecium circinans]
MKPSIGSSDQVHRTTTTRSDLWDRTWRNDSDYDELEHMHRSPSDASTRPTSYKSKESALPLPPSSFHTTHPDSSLARPGDTAPPNSPFCLANSISGLAPQLRSHSYPSERKRVRDGISGFDRYAAAERLYNAYASREKMFLKNMDMNHLRNQNRVTMISIPQMRLDKVFRRFMRQGYAEEDTTKKFAIFPLLREGRGEGERGEEINF